MSKQRRQRDLLKQVSNSNEKMVSKKNDNKPLEASPKKNKQTNDKTQSKVKGQQKLDVQVHKKYYQYRKPRLCQYPENAKKNKSMSNSQISRISKSYQQYSLIQKSRKEQKIIQMQNDIERRKLEEKQRLKNSREKEKLKQGRQKSNQQQFLRLKQSLNQKKEKKKIDYAALAANKKSYKSLSKNKSKDLNKSQQAEQQQKIRQLNRNKQKLKRLLDMKIDQKLASGQMQIEKQEKERKKQDLKQVVSHYRKLGGQYKNSYIQQNINMFVKSSKPHKTQQIEKTYKDNQELQNTQSIIIPQIVNKTNDETLSKEKINNGKIQQFQQDQISVGQKAKKNTIPQTSNKWKDQNIKKNIESVTPPIKNVSNSQNNLQSSQQQQSNNATKDYVNKTKELLEQHKKLKLITHRNDKKSQNKNQMPKNEPKTQVNPQLATNLQQKRQISPQKTSNNLREATIRQDEKQKQKNRTRIKFIQQMETDLDKKSLNYYQMLGSSKLNSRSLSLPMINRNTQSPANLNKKMNKNESKSSKNIKPKPDTITESQKIQQRKSRVQKQKQLNSVGYLLLNLKQKVSDVKNRSHYSYGISSNVSENKKSSRILTFQPKNNTDMIEINSKTYVSQTDSPFKYKKILDNNNDRKKASSILELSNNAVSPVKESPNKKPSIVESESRQTKKLEQQKASSQAQIDSDVRKTQQSTQESSALNNSSNPKVIKLNKKKEHLEQIKQDIENQNIEKQQLLKQRRNMNKNLQIDVINRRQRINQLQAEINKYQILDNQEEGTSGNIQTTKNDDVNQNKSEDNNVALSRLQSEKQQKIQRYNIQKKNAKEQIKKIQQRISEQEQKFKNLKQEQISLKNQELEQKQQQMQLRSRKLADDLQLKNKQLEQIIKMEQKRAQLYSLELEEQNRKNKQIVMELNKQQQLQTLLLKQIQKINKQRKHMREKKELQKNNQKIRLIQQIKQLEQNENKLLMQFQRDSQAINNIYQSMRLKNIQLQNSIREKRKQQSS